MSRRQCTGRMSTPKLVLGRRPASAYQCGFWRLENGAWKTVAWGVGPDADTAHARLLAKLA